MRSRIVESSNERPHCSIRRPRGGASVTRRTEPCISIHGSVEGWSSSLWVSLSSSLTSNAPFSAWGTLFDHRWSVFLLLVDFFRWHVTSSWSSHLKNVPGWFSPVYSCWMTALSVYSLPAFHNLIFPSSFSVALLSDLPFWCRSSLFYITVFHALLSNMHTAQKNTSLWGKHLRQTRS